MFTESEISQTFKTSEYPNGGVAASRKEILRHRHQQRLREGYQQKGGGGLRGWFLHFR